MGGISPKLRVNVVQEYGRNFDKATGGINQPIKGLKKM